LFLIGAFAGVVRFGCQRLFLPFLRVKNRLLDRQYQGFPDRTYFKTSLPSLLNSPVIPLP
jgi:hypothetical protein